jgi:hypothetical protein
VRWDCTVVAQTHCSDSGEEALPRPHPKWDPPVSGWTCKRGDERFRSSRRRQGEEPGLAKRLFASSRVYALCDPPFPQVADERDGRKQMLMGQSRPAGVSSHGRRSTAIVRWAGSPPGDASGTARPPTTRVRRPSPVTGRNCGCPATWVAPPRTGPGGLITFQAEDDEQARRAVDADPSCRRVS